MTSHLFPTSTLQRAATLVDQSGVAGMFALWADEDRKHRGGRTTSLPTRAVLIAWVAVAMAKEPLHMTRVAEVLSVRLSSEGADILGVPVEFMEVEYNDMCQRVDRASEKFLKLMDFKPVTNRRRKLLKSEWDAELEEREERAEEYENRRRRLFRFANELLRAQYDSLPEPARTDQVSISIDATFLSAFARGIGKDRLAAKLPEETYMSEPDGRFYIRTYEQNDGTAPLKKRGFGWEYELAVLISNDPARSNSVPHIAIGFNQHQPNADSNIRAREIFDDIRERGLEIDHAVADQAYFPGAVADVLQNPLRRGGAKLVMNYAKSQDGREANGVGTIQATAHGAIMVEGRWYCPVLPAVNRNAMVDYQKAVKADRDNPKLSKAQRAAREKEHAAERDLRIQGREKWEMRQKEKPDARGQVPMMCPASGPGRTLSCPLKPDQKPLSSKTAAPLPVKSPPKAPGKVCTNMSSTTFHLDDDGKYGQYYRFQSPDWRAMHSYGRQTVESYNKSLKHDDNVLHSNGTRRLKGEARQAFLAVLGVVATNADRISNWMADHYDESSPAPHAASRRGRTEHPAPVRATRGPNRKKGISASRAAKLGLPSSF